LGLVAFCHLALIHLFHLTEKADRQKGLAEGQLERRAGAREVAVAQHPEVEARFPLEQKVLY
jgi:hypothetical protein